MFKTHTHNLTQRHTHVCRHVLKCEHTVFYTSTQAQLHTLTHIGTQIHIYSHRGLCCVCSAGPGLVVTHTRSSAGLSLNPLSCIPSVSLCSRWLLVRPYERGVNWILGWVIDAHVHGCSWKRTGLVELITWLSCGTGSDS